MSKDIELIPCKIISRSRKTGMTQVVVQGLGTKHVVERQCLVERQGKLHYAPAYDKGGENRYERRSREANDRKDRHRPPRRQKQGPTSGEPSPRAKRGRATTPR